MGRHRSYRRSDLFLVRLWAEETGDATDGRAISDSNGNVEWHGKVQRVVDGEAHQFDGWQSLVDTLLSMLLERSGTSGGTPPTREPATNEQTKRSER